MSELAPRETRQIAAILRLAKEDMGHPLVVNRHMAKRLREQGFVDDEDFVESKPLPTNAGSCGA